MILLEVKICNKCGIEKNINEFEFRKDRNSYRNTCKECRRKASKEKYELYKDKRNESRRKRYNENKEEINKQRRELYNLNKNEINFRRRAKAKTELTPFQKLKQQVYNAICKSYERKGFVRTKTVEEILGRDLEEYVQRMIDMYEYSYKKPYNEKDKLCVDHIIPIWTARTVEELDDCNRCLQLLPEEENRRKGGKMSNGIGKNGKVIYEYYDPHWFDEDE